VLKAVEALEGNTYLRSTREHLESTKVDVCAKGTCAEEAELTCSRCKSAGRSARGGTGRTGINCVVIKLCINVERERLVESR